MYVYTYTGWVINLSSSVSKIREASHLFCQKQEPIKAATDEILHSCTQQESPCNCHDPRSL